MSLYKSCIRITIHINTKI